MKRVSIFLFFLFLGIHVFSAKVIPLADILKPHFVAVDTDHAYICENESIYIYSLENSHLIKKFGQRGEGPGEFKGPVAVNTQPDRLFVDSVGKVSIFSKEGHFIHEVKKPNSMIRQVIPYRDYFIAVESRLRQKRKVNLYNAQFEKIKEIYIEAQARALGEIYKNPLMIKWGFNQIFITTGNRFELKRLDLEGNTLGTIKKSYDLIPFSKDHQNAFLESYKTSPVTRQFYESFKRVVKFPEYFPAIKKFFVTDKIYVQTYLVDKGKAEFYVFNKEGKMEKRLLLPVLDNDFLSPAVYSIANGKIYHLRHNEKNDQWEMHILKLGV